MVDVVDGVVNHGRYTVCVGRSRRNPLDLGALELTPADQPSSTDSKEVTGLQSIDLHAGVVSLGFEGGTGRLTFGVEGREPVELFTGLQGPVRPVVLSNGRGHTVEVLGAFRSASSGLPGDDGTDDALGGAGGDRDDRVAWSTSSGRALYSYGDVYAEVRERGLSAVELVSGGAAIAAAARWLPDLSVAAAAEAAAAAATAVRERWSTEHSDRQLSVADAAESTRTGGVAATLLHRMASTDLFGASAASARHVSDEWATFDESALVGEGPVSPPSSPAREPSPAAADGRPATAIVHPQRSISSARMRSRVLSTLSSISEADGGAPAPAADGGDGRAREVPSIVAGTEGATCGGDKDASALDAHLPRATSVHAAPWQGSVRLASLGKRGALQLAVQLLDAAAELAVVQVQAAGALVQAVVASGSGARSGSGLVALPLGVVEAPFALEADAATLRLLCDVAEAALAGLSSARDSQRRPPPDATVGWAPDAPAGRPPSADAQLCGSIAASCVRLLMAQFVALRVSGAALEDAGLPGIGKGGVAEDGGGRGREAGGPSTARRVAALLRRLLAGGGGVPARAQTLAAQAFECGIGLLFAASDAPASLSSFRSAVAEL